MDYKQSFMEEQYNRMVERDTIGYFLRRFAQSTQRDIRDQRQDQRTVILFPGGMASELARARTAFDPTLPTGSYNYETIWYDVFGVLFLQHTLQLDMDGDSDKDRQIVVADGAIKNCVYSPYDDFREWCEGKDLDLLVMGWDFRRRPDWVVEFFFDYLVPRVTELATDANLPDPFARVALVGHSFGGMVVKWILNQPARPFCQNDGLLAVTVGTPFYGSAGQPHRYFVGEPLAGLTAHRAAIAKVIATFKGGFTLMFLDDVTYMRFKDELATDSSVPQQPWKYRRTSYPSVADNDPALKVDPYNPPPGSNGWFRYPQLWPWFRGYLDQGLGKYQEVAEPLDASVQGKLHCIRGVKFQNGNPVNGTAVAQRWRWVRADPGGQSAVWEKRPDAAGPHDFGPGDGTIPAWSARLVTLPRQQVHDIEGDISHMSLLDDSDVRVKLLELIRGIEEAPDQQIMARELRIEPAARDVFYQVRNRLEQLATEGPIARARRRVQMFIAEIPFHDRLALMKRWYMEVLTGPIMPLANPPDGEQPEMPPKGGDEGKGGGKAEGTGKAKPETGHRPGPKTRPKTRPTRPKPKAG